MITPNISWVFFLDESLLIFAVPYFNTLSPFYLWFYLIHALHGERKVPPHASPLTDLAAQTEDEGVRAE